MPEDISQQDLNRWAESLSAIARTGLGFTESLYEQERFEEVLKIAADIAAAANPNSSHTEDSERFAQHWLGSVTPGVAGYVTPKLAVGAVVSNEQGELLLVQRADSGVWLYPTGWADAGYSASEVVVKEVSEETGLDVEPTRLIAVLDGLRRGFTAIPLYSLIFQCRLLGGNLKAHPLECSDVGWFPLDKLPEPLAGADRWLPVVRDAIAGEPIEVWFDRPRSPVWRESLD